MINWKKVGEEIPSNANKLNPDAEEEKLVSCLVWVCNPKIFKSGVLDIVSWHKEINDWYMPDTLGKYIYSEPNQITHFCDEINYPGNEIKK